MRYLHRLEHYLRQLFQRHSGAAVWSLTALAFLVRLVPIRTGTHIWDEYIFLLHAEVMGSGPVLYEELVSRPPLLPLLLAIGNVIYHGPVSSHAISALIGALGLPCIYYLGARLYKPAAGLIAALLYGFSPFMVWKGHDVMTDIPAAVLGCLAVLLLFQGKGRYHWRDLAAGAALAASILVRFAALFNLGVAALYYLLFRRSIPAVLAACAGLAIGTLPYFIWVATEHGTPWHTLVMAWGFTPELHQSPWYYPKRFSHIFSMTALIGAACLPILWLSFRREHAALRTGYRKHLFLLIWMLGYYIYIDSMPHKEPRYLIPAAVPLYLLAGRGFSCFHDLAGRAKPIVSGAIVIILLASSWQSLAVLSGPLINPAKSEVARVGEHLGSAGLAGRIYANHEYPALAYHSRREVTRICCYYSEFYGMLDVLMPDPGYLVYSEYAARVYRRKGLAPSREWLDRDPRFHKLEEWTSYALYSYTPAAAPSS